MTPHQFADATWFVVLFAGVGALFTSDYRVFRWCMALAGAWLLAVLVMAATRG